MSAWVFLESFGSCKFVLSQSQECMTDVITEEKTPSMEEWRPLLIGENVETCSNQVKSETQTTVSLQAGSKDNKMQQHLAPIMLTETWKNCWFTAH